MSKQQTIPCQEARQLVAAGAQLVDVRSPQEHAQGALPGSVNLPLQILQDCLHQLDSSKPVIVYCASGMRSQQAAQALGADGRTTVYDLGSYQNLVAC
jgi:rhodanese-related sulfurtransferase